MHEKGIARYIVQAGEWDRIMEGLVIGVVKGDMVDITIHRGCCELWN